MHYIKNMSKTIIVPLLIISLFLFNYELIQVQEMKKAIV